MWRGRDEPLDLGGFDDVDTIVTSKILSLVVPMIHIGFRIAFSGIDDEGSLSFAELAG